MNFLGHEHEINELRKIAATKAGSKLVVIYGRWRVGKTQLVEEDPRQQTRR